VYTPTRSVLLETHAIRESEREKERERERGGGEKEKAKVIPPTSDNHHGRGWCLHARLGIAPTGYGFGGESKTPTTLVQQ